MDQKTLLTITQRLELASEHLSHYIVSGGSSKSHLYEGAIMISDLVGLMDDLLQKNNTNEQA